MTALSSKEVSELLVLASLRADRARSDVALAQRAITDIQAFQAEVMQPRSSNDPAARLAQERWLTWRHGRLEALNRELAIARAKLSTVSKSASRVIAREEVIKELLARTEQDEQKMAAKNEVERQIAEFTFLGGQYR